MIHQPCPPCLKDRRLVCFDLETTGLSKYNTIIELGVVEVVGGEVKTSYSRMFSGGHSSMYLVRKVHHIRDSERAGNPTFRQCAERISRFMDNSILVTHNGNSFDIPMIQGKLEAAGCPLVNFKSVDTLQLVRRMRKEEDDRIRQAGREAPHHSNTLGGLCREFGLVYGGEDGGSAHRGLEDAEATLDLLFYLVNAGKVQLAV